MFFKKQKALILLLISFIIPTTAFAYSPYIIASGKTVGIKLLSDGIIVAGSYDIDGNNPALDANIKTGDIITHINDKKVSNVDDMVKIINKCNCKEIEIDYKRGIKTHNTTLKLYYDDNSLKTGLYVKDSISGIGTLTFIDPNTKKFGVLGHEISNSETGEIIESNSGTIFDAEITSINKSERGLPGEKNAVLYSKEIKGKIMENTMSGLFGNYTTDFEDSKLYKVASFNEIKTGEAKILTVLDGYKVGKYKINIKKVEETENKLRNISFEITDKELLKRTNGIVQGMSGSPIIQGDNIIGAVTHVVVDDPHKGYGILITNMLEEAEN